MSNEIDWSKAPEWATEVRTLQSHSLCWFCEDGYNFNMHNNNNKSCWSFGGQNYYKSAFTFVEKRPSTEWNGEGLPPVGTVCEYKGAGHYLEWSEVKIFAAWGNQVFIDYGSGWRVERDAERFRPIRSAEQIEAEQREQAVQAMADDIGSLPISTKAIPTLYALYNAGYRKVESEK